MDTQFQDRLNRLRRERGLSQEDLAEVVGVTRQAVQKWESGASRPDMDNLAALARYFGVTLDHLVLGRDPGTGSPPGGGQTVINNYYHPSLWEYEYKSERTLWGLPLVHIHLKNNSLVRAKGIIAVGNVAVGLVSAGIFSVGVLSFGVLALGVLALGCLAAGVLLPPPLPPQAVSTDSIMRAHRASARNFFMNDFLLKIRFHSGWGSRGRPAAMSPRRTLSGVKRSPSAILPEAVRKDWARFMTTPSFFRLSMWRGPTRRALRIRRAEVTPTPGIRSRVS